MQKRVFRTFGLSESVSARKIQEGHLPPQAVVSYRDAFPGLDIVLELSGGKETGARIEETAQQVKESIGAEYVFSEDFETPLEKAVYKLLIESKKTIAVAESCTGGMLGQLLTKPPGASKCFLGGVICYSNQSKVHLLGVEEEALRKHGAVSFEAAEGMAAGARRAFGAEVGLSITGIAGPEGGSAEKPVGTFFVGLSSAPSNTAYRCFFDSSRQRIRTYAAYSALDVVRRCLTGLPVHWPALSAAI